VEQREGPQFCDALQMVGMGVGDQDRVQRGESAGKRLLSEVRSCVNDNCLFRFPGIRSRAEVRNLLSQRSSEQQTGQEQPSLGIPSEVPVPRSSMEHLVMRLLPFSGERVLRRPLSGFMYIYYTDIEL